MNQPTGVYKNQEGAWTWHCPCCNAEAQSPVTNRAAARDAYKVHRLGTCTPGIPESTKTTTETTTANTQTLTITAEAKKGKERKVPKKKTTKKKAKTTAKKKVAAAKKQGGKPTWRFAFVDTKRGTTTVWVSKKGEFTPARAEALGRKRAKRWGEVQAATRAEALKLLRAGKGNWFTPKGPEK